MTAHPTHAAAARAWLAQDPDAETRAELEALLARAEAGDPAADAELADRFGTRLAFGTAGLRGRLGAGSNRMNRVLVAQAAAGLAAFLRAPAATATAAATTRDQVISRAQDVSAADRPDSAGSPDLAPAVVIGYDGRRNSGVFARDSAEVLAGAGLRAILLPRMLPTPLLAFAVRYLRADAGIMVTASHNPPDDNGYKVYLGGADEGAQIVSPTDAAIAAEIARVAAGDIRDLPRSDAYEIAHEGVVAAYVEATAAVGPAGPGAAGLRWAYTAMHGVGAETFAEVVASAGYPAWIPVTAQLEPDPAFPTVAFPNPEEPGAMDLALETARDAGAELVIAHDPDADRLAVAIPHTNGTWRRLSGNEVGLLLGWRAARAAHAAGAHGPEASLASSLVSSPALRAVAEHYRLAYHATLTGFKWISRAPGLVYGFEEALGYLVNPETVRDKDGLSAAVAILDLASRARAEGRDLGDLVREFGDTFGHFASVQVSLRFDDVRVAAGIMASLRADPPRRVDDTAVARFDDLLDGVDGLPPGDVLRLELADGSRILVRPSGTEPKLKAYLDARADSAGAAAARLESLGAATRALLSAAS
ncbi:phospho-sugar mutase [Microbacterium sp. X-17]|uniref:phospho-sugar mutase n=1 Tax=Microbacterium sp. X-17 TaxID=3144404 RepID=UPI0031F4E7FA